MVFRGLRMQLADLRRENEVLKAENAKLKSDRDFIAMMTDVELEPDTVETENVEEEVADDE